VVIVGDNTIHPLRRLTEPITHQSILPLRERQGAAEPSTAESGSISGITPERDITRFSDEVHEPEPAQSGFDNFRDRVKGIREGLGVQSSGINVSGDLAATALAVQLDQAESSGGTDGVDKIGLPPGMRNAGILSSNRTFDGLRKGMQSAGVFSSRREPAEAHQPGGGTASPDMVKLMVDYAHAVKSGHNVNNSTEDLTLKIMNDAGKNEKPLKSLLGLR
jgi:hypothetical protein